MLLWIVFGFIVGLIVNILYPTPSSFLGTILLSILGAYLGGFLATTFLTGQDLSTVAALSGIVILLFIQRMLLRRI